MRRAEPEELDVTVLYEDESIIAIDKPPGMVVHPTYKNWTGTLLNALLWRVRHNPGVVPRIVTRLDKDTSGLVLAALAPEVHARIQRDAAAGRVLKEYLAVVCGIPEPLTGTIALPLARDPADRRRVVVTPAGAPCVTRYEVLAASGEPLQPDSAVSAAGEPRCLDNAAREQPHDDRALVRCELVTGRTHQIRVHLASCGWPILGDPVYGHPHAGIARQALHAWRIALPHPASRLLLQLEAPVPPDLDPLIAPLSWRQRHPA